ncbi:MAG: prepilin peptidase [Clostridia bacterium]|nr:prepilin peptidase [Clostridia bacterium]
MIVIFCNIVIALISLAINPMMVNLIDAFANDDKITLKGIFSMKKFDVKIGLITAFLLIALFFKLGISFQFLIYAFLSIVLIMDAFVDIKAQIIPNGLNFTCFIVGIIIMYLNLVFDHNTGIDMLLGMFTGAGIFALIALFAFIAYRKEGMGLGDVKLMGVLGLFFGVLNTIQIFIVSFAIGALVSIVLLITKVKKSSDYLAFGPFIVIASIITMFMPHSVMFPWYVTLINNFCNLFVK